MALPLQAFKVRRCVACSLFARMRIVRVARYRWASDTHDFARGHFFW